MLSKNVPWRQQRGATVCLESKMAAGVHQDRRLTEPLQSMADQTDVGMEREDLGPMMSTGLQVWKCAF